MRNESWLQVRRCVCQRGCFFLPACVYVLHDIVWNSLSRMVTEAVWTPGPHSHWSHISLIESDSGPASWLTRFALNTASLFMLSTHTHIHTHTYMDEWMDGCTLHTCTHLLVYTCPCTHTQMNGRTRHTCIIHAHNTEHTQSQTHSHTHTEREAAESGAVPIEL